MKNEKYFYFVEGQCEQKLINELKSSEMLPPGRTVVFNVLTKKISKSRIMDISKRSVVIMVFDTDACQEITTLSNNVSLLKTQVEEVKVLYLIQVENLEDELIRSTDIKKIEELTNSRSEKDFKSDFLKQRSCLPLLEKHHFDLRKIWITEPPRSFACFKQGINELLSRC